MGDKKTLSRKRSFMWRQTQHEAEVNFVATKTNIVAIRVEKITKRMLRHKNSCYGRIKNLRQKSLSRQRKIMLRK